MNNDKKSEVSAWSILLSAFAGLIGIQSDKNRERDFKSGKFWYFFLAGIVVTLLFILGVWLMVKLILSTTPTN